MALVARSAPASTHFSLPASRLRCVPVRCWSCARLWQPPQPVSMVQQSTVWSKWHFQDQAAQTVLMRQTSKQPKLPCHLAGWHQRLVLNPHFRSLGLGRAFATTRYQGEKNLEFDLRVSRPDLLVWTAAPSLTEGCPKGQEWRPCMVPNDGLSLTTAGPGYCSACKQPDEHWASVWCHLSRRPASHW